MICVVFHITSFVATEREFGMSDLIDAMLPGGSAFRGRLIRQSSTYLSFVAVYLPGWIAVASVLSAVVFPKTSHGIPLGYNLFSGLAFSSFSMFGASIFNKASFSEPTMVIITLVAGMVPQVLGEQSRSMVAILSLLFPSANYTYFMAGLAQWELSGEDVDLMKPPTEDHTGDFKHVKMYLYWLFMVIQILVYPILAFGLEHLRFSAASPGRIFSQSQHIGAPTVQLANFSKT